jgi:hypothetical protein
MKQKKEKFMYKILRPEQVRELQSKPTEELLKDYLDQSRKVQIVKRQKKEDEKLKGMRDRIKKHRDSSTELQEAKQNVKDVRESVDEDIMDDIEDKKALEGGYRDEIKGFNEMAHAIQSVIDRRAKV